eukprot:Nk52_evm5s150 gene=Nk52_evmTU5s150
MKIVILGAGYGTRLQRDLTNNKEYSQLLGVPKPLLPIGPAPLISHWLHRLHKEAPPGLVDPRRDVYVVCNNSNVAAFREWAKGMAAEEVPLFDTDHIASDGTESNEARIGAVGCMEFAVNHFGLDKVEGDKKEGANGILFIGGDTLFFDDFNLGDFLQRYRDNMTGGDNSSQPSLVTCYTETEERVSKTGIIEVDAKGIITSFLEKPAPTETSSRLACPCFYCFSPQAIVALHEFMQEKKDAPLQERDATGKFVDYLHRRLPVGTYHISGRFDVGGLDSYISTCEYFDMKMGKK